MTKEDFIEEWKQNPTTEQRFKDDLESVIASEQLKMVMNGPCCIQNSYIHVQKCPECNGWIFFNDKDVTVEMVGGMQIGRRVHCDACKKDQLLYPWRCI